MLLIALLRSYNASASCNVYAVLRFLHSLAIKFQALSSSTFGESGVSPFAASLLTFRADVVD